MYVLIDDSPDMGYYYRGKDYYLDYVPYPWLCDNIKEAKKYKSAKVAFNVSKRINNLGICGYTFKVKEIKEEK